MNRPWLYARETLQHFHGNYTEAGLVAEMRNRHPYLVDLERIATKRGIPIHDVFQGSRIGTFTVLAPTRERYIKLVPDFEKTPTSYKDDLTEASLLKSVVAAAKKWLDERWDVETLSDNPQPPTSASNESCVVQYASLDDRALLLTADVGPEGLSEAADYAAFLGLPRPKLVQMPHHGSRHNVTPAVLDRWLGPRKAQGEIVGQAICSIGADKTDYPRGQVKNAFIRRGYKVTATRHRIGSYSAGGGHPGWSPVDPEPFDDKVEPA